jgi:uroporphyrinogen decarboxylase
MTHRERFVRSLSFLPVDRPAKTDMFCLVPEALARPFPAEESIDNSSGKKRKELVQTCAEMYLEIADLYDHDCIFVWHPFDGDGSLDVISALRGLVGNDRAILGLVNYALWGLEQISDHVGFAIKLVEDRDSLHAEAAAYQERAVRRVRALAEAGADVAYVPNDVAFNDGPYFAPPVYEELIFPYAQTIFAEIRKSGMLGVYHTDGNIMKLLDQIMALGAHALQSIDPLAGMDIREVKAKTDGRLALLGNVQCDLLQEGPESAIRESARYCLTHASPGSGYVYMASNSIFEGMPLSNYLVMQDEYNRFVAGM